MKRMIPLLLAICLCAVSLFGCAAKQPERAKREILPEVAQALEMDDKDVAEVEKLFESFDEAFARLEKEPTDKDYFKYAKAVGNEGHSFYTDCLEEKLNLLSSKIDNTQDEDEKERILKLQGDCVNILRSCLLVEVRTPGEYNPELDATGKSKRDAEVAFALVNEYSNFFYGVDWITEEQLDSLG